MRAADGHLQLIDLVGLTGEPMTELICTDIDAFFDIIPREECRYLLDIPYFGRDENSEERDRLVAAFRAKGPERGVQAAGAAGRERTAHRRTDRRAGDRLGT